MADRQTQPADDDEEILEALGELLAADHMLDIIVSNEREEPAAPVSDGAAGDEKTVTGEA